jgi:hypothetical protein
MPELTHERLRALLDYDAATGVLTWRSARGPRKAGAVAGSATPDDYVQVMVDGQNYKAHRLAWFWVHGAWPESELDHRAGKTADNRLEDGCCGRASPRA